MNTQYHFAIDGNEANVVHRVGSNAYAYELLKALRKQTRLDTSIQCTVLLSSPPLKDLPAEHERWKYSVIRPRPFWTQWALPLHLFIHKSAYSAFFTPGHYAPRHSVVPYISSVMDTAYISHPDYFTQEDRTKLTRWTHYSVSHAKKVLAISKHTKQSVIETYNKDPDDVFVAYPALAEGLPKVSQSDQVKNLKELGVTPPYILFVGTIQPRKNIERLVEAYEIFLRKRAGELLESTKKHSTLSEPPQLVLAGKMGWLTKPIQQRIEQSPYKSSIIVTGYVSEAAKITLMKNAVCITLVGLSEGFGIPPLEAMSMGTIPVVSNNTSLPEVVGGAGITVDPLKPHSIARGLWEAYALPARKKNVLKRKLKEQVASFSWDATAKTVLSQLKSVSE